MKFQAKIEIISVNLYVIPPQKALEEIFKDSGKSKGPIQIKGKINSHKFIQTLVRYQNAWRLYINTPIIKATGVKVGDTADFSIEFDNVARTVPINPKLKLAFDKNKKAKEEFEKLIPSRQKEINRYLNNIKSEEVLEKNVDKVIRYLNGEKVDYFVILRN
ncbi:MAG TPA: YdeI/OmpD-associated family protein [Patescibacteria group bacterium]|nr:YdeI/OmpD-associated family protein [Patescibacteria group bacterium]